LSRGQLVLLALLVGSDYTMGLTGVGPVTALEILSVFSTANPNNQQVGVISEQPDDLVAPLRSFREWWAERQAVHTARLRKLRSKLKDLNIHEGEYDIYNFFQYFC
jgi:DNA excision repair protein ERCC-5